MTEIQIKSFVIRNISDFSVQSANCLYIYKYYLKS